MCLAGFRTDLCLAGDEDLRDFGAVQIECTLMLERLGADFLQLTTFGVDHPPGADIDGEREEDDEPDGAVEDGNSKVVPAQRDPTPQLMCRPF